MKNGGSRERVRLADLATEAGVSLATMSKVLNGRADVAPATRERVERLLAERGYARRTAGSEARTDLIELGFPELNRIRSMELIEGGGAVAKEHGMSDGFRVGGNRHARNPRRIGR